MYQFLKTLKANCLVSAILCVLFGVTLVVWPDISSRVVCTGLGCVLALTGLVNLITFFTRRDGTLLAQLNVLAGIVLFVLGAWIILKPERLIMVIPVVVGIIIIIHGVHDVMQAVGLWKQNYDKWWVALLLGIATAGFGGLLVCNPFEVVSTMIILIGVLLIFDGISDIWIISRISRTAKAVVETMEALDVDAVDITGKDGK